MADRIHQYPMFPQSLTPNSLQQSQIPQQTQSQQPDPQIISALSNPEHARMWQQMNQLQSAYRPPQSGDLAPSQMNHQMQEFARGQALSHTQGQPMVQPSFGLNAQRMNPSVFHDPQTGQSQSLIPPNFANVPVNTQQQIKAPFNMNPMMHSLNNPGVSRHLNMLNQQELARFQQQASVQAQLRQSNQQPSVDMFAPPSVQPQDQMHGSPHPSAQTVGPLGPSHGLVSGNSQQNLQKRVEFQERQRFLLASIAQSEGTLTSLLQTARNGGSVDPALQQKITQLRTDINNRKDLYAKLVGTVGSIVAQQMANGIPSSSVSHMNPMAHPNSQQPPQSTVANGQVQPGFVSQPNQPVAGQYNTPPNVPSPLTTQAQAGATLNQQIPIQPTHTQIGLPNSIPARTAGTPHQIPSGQLPNVMSPNLGNLAVQGGQKIPNQPRQQVGILPLDKARFDSTYLQFCRSQNMNSNLHVPIGENRTVDLHLLHVCVMQEGGARTVTIRDLWAVIGGRLGFIQFPGNESEPGRCGPGLAQQLQNTYEQYLQHFENAYILTVKNRSTAGSSQQQMNGSPLAMDNNATTGMSGNAEIPQIPPRPLNQQVIAAAARYAHTSAQDMRAQRVQEPMIGFVERHRPELQKVYQQQLQLLAKRQAEQEQRNLQNVQNHLSIMHDPPMGSQAQRPMGANSMVNMASGDAKMVNGSFAADNIANGLPKQLPTQDQLQQASTAVNYFKQVFQQRSLPDMPLLQIPDDQRLEYNQLLEVVYKMTSELESRLHLYFIAFRNEEFLRKYVAIVLMVARQRQLLRIPSPQFIVNLNTLRTMQVQIHKFNEEFENRWRAIKASSTLARLNSASVPPPQNTSQITSAPQLAGRQVPSNPLPPPRPQPSPSQTHIQPPPPPPSQLQPQPNLPQVHPQLSAAQMKKPFHSSIPRSPSVQPVSATVASPTPPPPVASSSTPATSAPTPQTTAASPQTPKSPPSKAVQKTKAARTTRKPSTAGKSPATPETVPSIAGVKRPPEDEVATLTSVAPSEAEASNAPSPKKAKTEWEGEASEALVKKQQQIENIKTDEDAASFLDQMKELVALTATADERIHYDIASTLGQILAGMPQDPPDGAAAFSIHGVGDVGPPPTALSPHMGPANDAFLEFIDFSPLDEDDSKAPTPDLVHSSETNPSPESGSEGESLGGSPDKTKNEDSGDRSDLLRLGSLKEIDGGESAYYQAGDWKWDGVMPTLDQPWAIFTS